MDKIEKFEGFGPGAEKFYRELSRHNDKAWFDAHRDRFEADVMAPARSFVTAMGFRLLELAPALHAEPRVNRSLFRINRDTRFAKDKTPYKTHLAIWLWEGERPRMECSGFYFHLEPGKLMLGAGIYAFPREHLLAYRDAVVDKKRSAALARAIAQATKAGLAIGVQHYKRVPTGYDPLHPHAELLKYNGLTAMWEGPPPASLGSAKLIDLCFRRYQAMAPLHQWLRELVRGL